MQEKPQVWVVETMSAGLVGLKRALPRCMAVTAAAAVLRMGQMVPALVVTPARVVRL